MSSKLKINDEFHKDGKLADVTLVVEDHKILVSKAVLSVASPVFCAMFDSDFQEKTEKEIQLPEKSYEDFVEFLRCIYPDKTKMITERNVHMLLPLAHEYNVEGMMKRCQQVLMEIVKKRHNGNVEELYRHINLSELYSLEGLKEKCIYLASEHTLRRLKAAKTACQILDESHYKIIELALRRRELDKSDDRVFDVCNTKEEQIYKNSSCSFGITCELKGHICTEGNSKREIYRALRLMERFKFTENHKRTKSELIEQLQYHYDDGEYMEEFYLLPESIKESVQNKK